MAIVTYSYARQNLAKLMDEVERECAPVFISRQRNRGAAVLISEDEWNSIQETLYLMSNTANAEALRRAMDQAERGELVEHDLIDP